MRRSDPTGFPLRLCAAILLAGVAGAAAGDHLQVRHAVSSAGRGLSMISKASAQAQADATYRFVDDASKLTPLLQPDVAAPKFSRIVIEKTGVSRLEGDGTPGSQVLIKSSGVMIGGAVVDANGRWMVALAHQLEAGDHAITSVAAGRETTQAGDEVRVYIPYNFAGREIVAYDRGRNTEDRHRDQVTGSLGTDDSTMQRAQDLAEAATQRFSEIVPPPGEAEPHQAPARQPPARQAPVRQTTGIDIATPVENWLARASQTYKDEVASKLSVPADEARPVELAQNSEQPPAPASEPNSGSGPEPGPESSQESALDPLSSSAGAVRSWLKDASDAYDREIATPLSVPTGVESAASQTATDQPAVKAPRPAADTSGSASEAAHKIQMEREAKQKAWRDAEDRADAQAKASAEAARQADEAKRRKADDMAAQARDAARAAADQARKDAEAKKIADGMKRLEAAQKADDARRVKEDARRAKTASKEEEPAAEPLPSEREADPASRRLEFTIDTDEDTARARRQTRQDDKERSRRVREAQIDDRRASAPPSRRNSHAATRVQSYQSRRDSARRTRACASSPMRNKGAKHAIYVVQPGDTLWAIANRHYRHGSRYNIIYHANLQRLPNADMIRPCQKLVLPLRGKRV